jgi:nucleoid DNA-binding protein
MHFSTTSEPTKDIISKRDIAEEIAKTHEISISKSRRILDTVLDEIVEVSRLMEDGWI